MITVLFFDEIHRFTKAPQDALLPGVGEPLRFWWRLRREPVVQHYFAAAFALAAVGAGSFVEQSDIEHLIDVRWLTRAVLAARWLMRMRAPRRQFLEAILLPLTAGGGGCDCVSVRLRTPVSASIRSWPRR